MVAKSKKNENFCDRELLEQILYIVQTQSSGKTVKPHLRLYDNKALMDLLRIKEKYLKKLRDFGYIGYSREGDKYWYTQEDVELFLRKFHHNAFASDPVYSSQEGGLYV